LSSWTPPLWRGSGARGSGGRLGFLLTLEAYQRGLHATSTKREQKNASIKKMRTLLVDPSAPDRAALERAAETIRDGGIVAVPTDTLYGLAVDPFNADAVRRVFIVKGRREGQALPLIAADLAQIVSRFGPLSRLARRLADRFWPGPMTLLIAAPAPLGLEITGGTGRIGVRVPAHLVARGLCAACDRPLTATSANLSGEPASDDPDEVARSLGDHVDLLVDAGRTPGGPPSTIVDVTRDEPQLVRAGAIPWDEVQACTRRA
jgi:L-threonylcarbamoyladenylate synthase